MQHPNQYRIYLQERINNLNHSHATYKAQEAEEKEESRRLYLNSCAVAILERHTEAQQALEQYEKEDLRNRIEVLSDHNALLKKLMDAAKTQDTLKIADIIVEETDKLTVKYNYLKAKTTTIEQ